MTTSTTITTDRIEKRLHLRATRARVWRALTDIAEFNAWFGCHLSGSFAPGVEVRGTMGCNGNAGKPMVLTVVRIDPQSLFSYRWHPYGADPAADPTTLVEFHLTEADGGTQLTVVESGFDALAPGRRETAFPAHEAGWVKQMANIGSHVAP